MNITRHDIPETVKTMIREAIRLNMIDAFDVYKMGIEHGGDWDALVDDLVEVRYAKRHIIPIDDTAAFHDATNEFYCNKTNPDTHMQGLNHRVTQAVTNVAVLNPVIKNYRSCRGTDGEAFSCTLHINGKKSALVDYDGLSGGYRYTWTNPAAQASWTDTLAPYNLNDPVGLDDCVLEQLIQKMLEVKKLKQLCRTKTLARLTEPDGAVKLYAFKVAFGPKVASQLRAEYGTRLVEIVNETL